MKKGITILAALLLLGTTNAMAADYPTQVSYCAENGIYEVRKVYEMKIGQEPSEEVRQDFQQDGYHFVLTDLLRQELPEQQRRDYSETVTMDSESKELKDIIPLLEETKAVTTEDGFAGTLALNPTTITVEPAGYKNDSWTVTAVRTYPNLSDMDLQYIPKTTTENGRTLEFSNVEWQADNTANVDDYAIGDRYSAVVTYAGTASSKSVTGYTVTAQYSGEIEKISLDKVQYVAIFHGTPIEPEKQPMDWRYLAIPAALLVLCGVGFGISKMKKEGSTTNEEVAVADADYEQISESGTGAESGAAGGDDTGSYPGVGS